MRNRAICLALVLVLALPVWAKPKIERIKAKKGSSIISIHFDNPLPSAAEVANTNFWVVVGESKNGVHRYTVVSVEPCLSPADVKSPDCNAVDGYVRLHLTENVLADNTKIDLTLINNTAIVNVPAFQLSKDQSGPLGIGKSKTDSDVYFSGSYTAVVNGDPVWDVDAFAGYMHSLGSGRFGQFGFYGQARTKKSDNADPNSFLDYLVWSRRISLGTKLSNGIRVSRGFLGPFEAPIFNYRVAGTEFDRDGKQLNFINSPVLTLPLRFLIHPENPVSPSVTTPTMTLQLGTEFVKVEKSRVLAPEKNWYTRGLLGATFSAGYAPEKPAFDSITFSSAYQVRLPTAGEIYFDKRNAPIDPKTGKRGTTPALLGTQARHNVDSKISYNFTKYLGISFEHTYGSLPPIFTRNEHSFALGFTLTLKQTSYGRYSILRP
jgi:hypothetical protein